MTMLDDREQAFEQRFAHDEEVRFKILSRRNLLFGRWAADLIGHTGDVSERYIQDIMTALCQPSDGILSRDDKVVSNTVRDLTNAGWAMSPDEVRAILAEFEAQAEHEVNTTALGD